MRCHLLLLAVAALHGCASPAGPPAPAAPRAYTPPLRSAPPPSPAPVYPPQRPAAPSASDLETSLLNDLVETSAPVAARAAQCGHWSGDYWLYQVVGAEVRTGAKGVGEAFTERFNAALNAPGGDVSRLPCDVVRQLALDYLVLWNRYSRGY